METTEEQPVISSITLECLNARQMYLKTDNRKSSLKSNSPTDNSILSALSELSLDTRPDADDSSDGDEKEEDYGNVDRFGFIVVASGRSPYEETKDEDQIRKEQERRGRKEARRSLKWVSMLARLEGAHISKWHQEHRKFGSRLIKGVPESLRTKVWSSFLQLSVPEPTFESRFRQLYLRCSGFERQIDLDIERTLRDHVQFRARFSLAQVSLFKVLVAYSNHDPDVGYCQGMSTIAAFLLLYFEEATAFQALVALFERDQTRRLFLAGFPLLFETFHVQEALLRKLLPRVKARLDFLGIPPSVYATRWYLTLFLGFPFALSTRIWDLYLLFGLDFLVCVALALLKVKEDLLLSSEYEHCMQLLSKLAETPLDEERIIRVACAIWKRLGDKNNVFERLRTQFRDLKDAKGGK